MTHYVLFKLKPEANPDEVYEKMEQGFNDIAAALDYFRNHHLYRNCINKPNNAEIMLQVELDTPEQLQTYLDHPIHVKLAKYVQTVVERKTPFDYDNV